jgi:hypothetical protein
MTGVRRIGLAVFLLEAVTLWVADRHRGLSELPKKPLPHLGGSISGFTATPGTITFTSSNPDASATSPSAQIVVNMTGPIPALPWNLKVAATSSSLGNCPSVPASAVAAVCSSFSGSAPLGNNAPTGGCSGSPALSTSYVTVASGAQGTGSSNTFTINMNYRFTDAWTYPGANAPACTLGLTYQFNWDI